MHDNRSSATCSCERRPFSWKMLSASLFAATSLLVTPGHAQQSFTPSQGVLIEPVPLTPVPGTRVSLAPPPGFLPSTQFPGFHRPDAGASIVVSEIPAPVEAVRAGMTEQALATQGMTLLSTTRGVAGGLLGTLYSVAEQVDGRPYRKWMALFGNDTDTVVISASFPELLASELALPLKQALLGSGWNPRARVDPQGGLSFRLIQSDGLRILRRVGNLLVLTDPARGARPAPTDPMLVVGDGVAERNPEPLDEFARERLRAFDRVQGLRDIAGNEAEVGGRRAYELTATADDVVSGQVMLVYQLLVPDGRRYTLAQGLCAVADEGLYLPRFRAVARSLEYSQ